MSAPPANPEMSTPPVVHGVPFPFESFENGEHGLRIWGPVTSTDHFTAEVLQKYGSTLNGATLVYDHRWPTKEPNAYLGKVIETRFDEDKGTLFARAEIYSDIPFQQEVIKDIIAGKTTDFSVGARSINEGGKKVENIVKTDFIELSVVRKGKKGKCTRPKCGIEGAAVFSEPTTEIDTEPKITTEVVALAEEPKVTAEVNTYSDEISALKKTLQERDEKIQKLSAEASNTDSIVEGIRTENTESIKVLSEEIAVLKDKAHKLEVTKPMFDELIECFAAPRDSEKYKENVTMCSEWNDDMLKAGLIVARLMKGEGILSDTEVVTADHVAPVGISREAVETLNSTGVDSAIDQLYKDANLPRR